ncbi:nitroreductase [Duganella levis]|uniref:Nitroreductase n=1 Tax=Duganella levis TaxID=2692169 RepID=A0ABW9W4X7_9BURK|nr:nitroreductase [Duganella levis]
MNIRVAEAAGLDAEHLRRAVDWTLGSRRSIRAYLPRPVRQHDLTAILDLARFCASGVNTQPWHVHVVTGQAKERLSTAILCAYDDPHTMARLAEPYDYYPAQWFSPYVDRRRAVGWDLYGLLGIEKGDKARMHQQHGRNYRFFDAPVGLLFTIDRRMGRGSLIDYGMFLQNIMLAARARGLDTCAQAAFNAFHEIIARELSIPAEQMLVCGMSLGYADLDSIENTLVTQRVAVGDFTTFHG